MMDPSTTLIMIRSAIQLGELEIAAEDFKNLDKWLSDGGFLPSQWERHRRETL